MQEGLAFALMQCSVPPPQLVPGAQLVLVTHQTPSNTAGSVQYFSCLLLLIVCIGRDFLPH